MYRSGNKQISSSPSSICFLYLGQGDNPVLYSHPHPQASLSSLIPRQAAREADHFSLSFSSSTIANLVGVKALRRDLVQPTKHFFQAENENLRVWEDEIIVVIVKITVIENG